MDYPNDSMNNDKQQENTPQYVDGVSTQPYVDRVYEPVKPAADGAMPEYTAHNVAYNEPVKPAKKQRHGVTALVLVLCMVASLIFGFGGGLILSLIPILGWIIAPIFSVLVTVLAVIGIINVANGRAKELPLIGKFKLLK